MSGFQNPPQELLDGGKDVLTGIEEKLEKLVHNVGIVLTGEECVVLKSVLKAVGNGNAKAISSTTEVGTKNFESVIESATPGYCYLKLMLCLPSISHADNSLLCELIVGLKSALGKNPQGKNFLVHLTMSESILSGVYGVSSITSDDPLILMDSNQHLRTLGKMMESKCCFTYEEVGGIFHVRDVSASCSCNEILCDHGWATRFMLQVITRDGCIVGADIDLSALFVEGGSNDTCKPLQHSKPSKGIGKPKPIPTREELQGDLEKDMVTMLSVTLDNRTNLLEKALKEMMNSKSQVDESANQSEDGSEPEDTIMPSDSSTQFERYGKRFMGSGTVYNVGRGGTKLDRIREELPPLDVPEVVQGFVRTGKMRESEHASLSQVYSINGLAAPFKSSRLNFLAHFHTALSESQIDSKTDPMEAMECIGELRPRNSTEELMKQVVLRTFDFDQMVIIANPFKLPFIEIGMLLTDSGLAKCFEFLKSEYRTLWFNEMKCLHVPQFHREFRQLSTGLGKARVHGKFGRLSQATEAPIPVTISRVRQSSTNPMKRGKPSSSQKSQSLLGFKF